VTVVDHLSASDIAAFIDGSLRNSARERAERHLSDCAQCREELVACTQLVGGVSAARRRQLLMPALGLAAAAALVLTIARRPSAPSPQPGELQRAARSTGPEIVLVSPANGANVSPAEVRFTWRAVAGAVGYHLVVTTRTGDPVLDRQAGDTSLVVRREPKFVSGGDFYWRVESFRADGGDAVFSHRASIRVVAP
jgi:anti-sigma factor RsiW